MYIGQTYMYVGRNNQYHKNGTTYRVIETGQHWYKELGFAIWVTTEEYPNTRDSDYGMAMDKATFGRHFWR